VNGFGLRPEASPTAAPSRSSTLAFNERVAADDVVGGKGEITSSTEPA
jgi:hypothetical protein